MRFALQHAITLALLATLAGLTYRKRLHLCLSFVAYALALLVCANLVVLWPARFFTPEFWKFKQALYDVCKLAVALELAYRVMRAFPGAQRIARRWVAALLVLSTGLIVLGPARVYGNMPDWQPRALLGIVWLMGLTTFVALYYRLPVHTWHRALLMGFSAYLMVFTVVLQILKLEGWAGAAALGRLDSVAYLALATWWAWSAWRLEPAPADIPVEVLRRLQVDTP